MSLKYYTVREELGYSYGQSDDDQNIPMGAVIFEKEADQLAEIEKLEKDTIQAHDDFQSELDPEKESDEDKFARIKKDFSTGQLKTILRNAGVKGYSKLKEDELIELILENKLL